PQCAGPMRYPLSGTQLVRAKGDALRFGDLVFDDRFNLVARLDPRVDPAVQRPHTLEAELAQLLGDFDRARFIRARAVDDHVIVGGHAVDAVLDELHVDAERTGNAAARRLRQRRADIQDRAGFALAHEVLQLVHGYAVHPQLLNELMAAPPFRCDVRGERGQYQNQPVLAERLQRLEDIDDGITEDLT